MRREKGLSANEGDARFHNRREDVHFIVLGENPNSCVFSYDGGNKLELGCWI